MIELLQRTQALMKQKNAMQSISGGGGSGGGGVIGGQQDQEDYAGLETEESATPLPSSSQVSDTASTASTTPHPPVAQSKLLSEGKQDLDLLIFVSKSNKHYRDDC